MYDENRLRELTPILQYYSLEPYFVENYRNIQKLYTNKGVFALKNIDPSAGVDFVQEIRSLFQKGYNRIVPVYPTIDGRDGVLFKRRLYYLMPWVSNEFQESRSRHEQLFRELARLHTLSAQEWSVPTEERTEHYDMTIAAWEKDEEFMNEFISHCEAKWYMSPFELLFCLYFHHMSQALTFSIEKLKEWYEKTKNEEKVRTVIAHGKISPDHFLLDDRGYGYFINFENAKRTSPIHDLLPFVSESSTGFPRKNDELVEWVYTYFKYFPLKEDEMLLFLSYLAHPSSLIRIAEKYYLTKSKKNELKFVRHLQQQYWYLKNIEFIVMKIAEIEQQKKQAEQTTSAQQES